jgi:hypothetical protein
LRKITNNMNNEIKRKLTSLTLMTIMLAGGMVIAAPAMVPEAAAAGKLFVSAENANFNNYFAGVNVVEIIVKDANANQTDESQPEPTVKVNENIVRMAQGADGSWYAYIADSTAAKAAWDLNIATAGGINIEFGYLDDDPAGTPSTGFPTLTTAGDVNTYFQSQIVAGAPSLSLVQVDGTHNSTTAAIGQIGIKTIDWPIIQTYDFTIETFEVKLEQPGTDEIVTLVYNSADIDDYSSVVLDRNTATQGADVHLTITDQALNIDPTTKDVVMFLVTGTQGVSFKATSAYTTTTTTVHDYVAFNNSFDENGILKINYGANGTAVLENVNTIDDAPIDNATGNADPADDYLIFFETAENSGIFVNTDDTSESSLQVKSDAPRGLTATIDYNNSAQSFIVGNDFATIDMVESSVGDEWNSGEEMTIIVHDQDLNKNSMKDEDLTVAGGTLVPSIQIGNPLSLSATSKLDAVTVVSVDDFSKIARADPAQGTANLIVDTGISIKDMYAFVNETDSDVFEYLSYNIKSLLTATGAITDVHVTSSNDAAVHLTAALASVKAQDTL